MLDQGVLTGLRFLVSHIEIYLWDLSSLSPMLPGTGEARTLDDDQVSH